MELLTSRTQKKTGAYAATVSFSIFLMIIVAYFENLFFGYAIIKFLVGIVVFLIVPGNLVFRTIMNRPNPISIAKTMASGFSIQSFNLLIYFLCDSIFGILIPDLFRSVIILATSIEISLCALTLRKMGTSIIQFKSIKTDFSSIVFCISTASTVIYLGIIGSFVAPDAALFCDIGRYIANHGTIGSFVINDGYQNPFRAPLGLIPHMGTALLFAFSFMIGSVNALFAQFSIMLLVPTIVGLVAEPFSDNSILHRIIMVPPLVLLPSLFQYSTSIFGPEIISLFFTISALFVLHKAITSETQSKRYFFLAGALMFFEAFAWNGNQLPLLIASGFIVILRKQTRTKIRTWIFPSISFLLMAYLPRISSNPALWLMLLYLFISFLVLSILLDITFSSQIAILSLGYFLFWQLSLVRLYLNPEVIISVASQSPDQTGGLLLLIPTYDQLLLSVYFLYNYIGPILLGLAILSIFYFQEGKMPLYSLLGGYLIFQFTGRYSYIIYEGRFYIGFSLCVICLSMFFISRVLTTYRPTNLAIQKLLMPISNANLKRVVALMIIIGISSFALNSSSYVSNSELVNSYSHSANGWDAVRDWTTNNIPTHDSILVLGSPRDWAWYLNRPVIGFYRFDGITQIPINEMNTSHLLDHIEEYSVDWIIVDTTATWWRRWIQLEYLYTSIKEGQRFIVQQGNRSYSMACVLKSLSNITNTPVIVWSVHASSERPPTYIEDFDNPGNWTKSISDYPLESTDDMKIDKGLLTLTVSNNDTIDFDRIYSNTPSLITANCTLETRFKVTGDKLEAVLFRVSESENVTGNWYSWLYASPPLNTWITVCTYLPELIGLAGRTSQILPTGIESVSVTAKSANISSSRVEVDYIHLGIAQSDNFTMTENPLLNDQKNVQNNDARIKNQEIDDEIHANTDHIVSCTEILLRYPLLPSTILWLLTLGQKE